MKTGPHLYHGTSGLYRGPYALWEDLFAQKKLLFLQIFEENDPIFTMKSKSAKGGMSWKSGSVKVCCNCMKTLKL